jgi:hypothetical protein
MDNIQNCDKYVIDIRASFAVGPLRPITMNQPVMLSLDVPQSNAKSHLTVMNAAQ